MKTTGTSQIVAIEIDSTPQLPAPVVELLEVLQDRTAELLEASKAPNTWIGYRSDWRGFASWSTSQGYPLPVDPETLDTATPHEIVHAYLLVRSPQVAPTTLARQLSAIKFWHHLAGLASPTDHPTVGQVMTGIVREANRQKRQAAPLYLSEIAAGLPVGADPKQIRDRAMLLVGWWGALRRSELVGINRQHLEDHPDGIIITLPRSKTDQTGQGRQIPLHYRNDKLCPVRALRAWLELVDGEPVFVRVGKWGDIRHHTRTGARTVTGIVKDAADRCGLDADRYTAHSLRAGFVSECDRRRIPTAAVRAVTGHTSEQMLSSYARPGQLFDHSAGAYFNGGEELETD